MKQNKTLFSKAVKAMLIVGVAVAAFPSSAYAGNGTTVQSVAQANVIKGHVVDENGEPMVGVTIRTKSGEGTISDMDGNFTINVAKSSTATISYTGYISQTVTLKNGTIINMKPDAIGLEDVVVVGYGTVKKKDLTGAVTSMKSQDIVIAPTNNAMEALQGKVAGLDISKTSGETGGGVNILLRGSRSIYGDNSPLFIIDGIQGGNYEDLNPSDIESIDVLKDASSTAIYGSAGANGVIIITTKRGHEGKAHVNFDAYWGWSGNPNYKHGMVGDEWMNYQREAYYYKNGSYPANDEALFGNSTYYNAYQQGKWIDWVDEAAGKKATTQKYSVSVTGGTAKTKIFASASYDHESGLVQNDNLKKYQTRLNIDQEVTKWLSVGLVSNLTHQVKNSGQKNTFTKSLTAFPLGDAYDEEGKLQSEYILNNYSPLGDYIENQYANNKKSTHINATGYAELRPFKGFSYRTQVSGTLDHSRTGQYWGEECNANLPSYGASPFAQKTNDDNWSYQWENIISYNITLADKHNIGVQGISSWTKSVTEQTIAGGSGQMVDTWSFHRLASDANNRYIYSDYKQTQKMSYAVRVNYSFMGKYLFNFSNRWDGVSWFSTGKKWDCFPAAAVAWRISDESFMSGLKNVIDNLKLRVGFGVTGNSGGTGAYVTQSQAYTYPQWGVSKEGQYVQFSQYTGTFAGSDLGWEKSYNWNIGLDFSILNSRIDGSIEWFSTRTNDLLFKRTLPITSGLTGWGSPLSSWQNLAKTSNTGLEFTINSRNIVHKNFKWNTTASITYSKEKIVSLPNGDVESESLFEGYPIGSIYGYKYVGLWQATDDAETMATIGVKPGFIKIQTNEIIASDGTSDYGIHKYSTKDRQILGHKNPTWIVGLNNTFQIYDFDLSIFAMGRFGQTIQSSLLGYYTASNSIETNQLSGADYWTETNTGAYYPRPGTASEQSTVYSALTVRNGSFIKIKNITLGYTLPKKYSKKIFMEKLRVYFTAYNPWIFAFDSKLKGTDPETGGSDSFPTYRQFVFGVNVTF